MEWFRSETKLEDLVTFSRVTGQDEVLEVAAGAGFVGRAMAKYASGSYRLTSFGYDEARDISRQEGISNADFLVADADQPSFADGKCGGC